MPIEFRCPSCRTDLRAPDSKRGTDGECPRCGAGLRVPRYESFRAQWLRAWDAVCGGRGAPGDLRFVGGLTMLFGGLSLIGLPVWAVLTIADVSVGRDSQDPLWRFPLLSAGAIAAGRAAVALMAGKAWARWPVTIWWVLMFGAHNLWAAVVRDVPAQGVPHAWALCTHPFTVFGIAQSLFACALWTSRAREFLRD